MEGEREICRYAYQVGEQCEVPRQYKHYLLSGQWQVAVLLEGQFTPIRVAIEQVLPIARTTFTLNRKQRES